MMLASAENIANILKFPTIRYGTRKSVITVSNKRTSGLYIQYWSTTYEEKIVKQILVD